eukprot:CFRG0846T1
MVVETLTQKVVDTRKTLSTDAKKAKATKSAGKYEISAEFRPDFEVTPTFKLIYFLSQSSSYVIPPTVATYLVQTQGWPPAWQLAMIPVMFTWLIGVPMSVCLHRYFSHGAFKCSREFQVVLGVLACMAYQQGPLWWASKHKRHHQYCDLPNDPHSVTQTGFLYSWVGWTTHTDEYKIDLKYVKSLNEFPELRFLDTYWFLPQMILHAILIPTVGLSFTVCFITVPMLVCRLITLLFNVEYHPVEDPRKCKAKDEERLLAQLVGEAYHLDHHNYPMKAKRPGWDLPYWTFLVPCEKAGLIWDLKGQEQEHHETRGKTI